MTPDDHRAKFIEAERRKMLEAKTMKDAKRVRDDHRAKCLGALAEAYYYEKIDDDEKFEDAPTDLIQACMESAASFLDSLHGIARVVPPESTREMMGAGQSEAEEAASLGRIFVAMSTVGDLTNPPERKP